MMMIIIIIIIVYHLFHHDEDSSKWFNYVKSPWRIVLIDQLHITGPHYILYFNYATIFRLKAIQSQFILQLS